MNIYQPYTYLIGWSKLDYWYYGVRFSKKCHPNDLWTTYFTSSNIVKEMRLWHGEPDVIQVRRMFRTREQTLRCEEKVLKKVKAATSHRWLNKRVGRHVDWTGRKRIHSLETRQKIGAKSKGRIPWNKGKSDCFSKEIVEKIRQGNIGKHAYKAYAPRDENTGRFISSLLGPLFFS